MLYHLYCFTVLLTFSSDMFSSMQQILMVLLVEVQSHYLGIVVP